MTSPSTTVFVFPVVCQQGKCSVASETSDSLARCMLCTNVSYEPQAGGSDRTLLQKEQVTQKAFVSSPEHLCTANDVNAFTYTQGNWLWHGSLYGMGVMPLVCSHQFPHYVEALQAMHISPILTFPVKLGLSFALCYHTFNGMRHLAWDLGLGYGLKELYTSGFFVLGLSLVTAAVLAFK
ncbi:hypothetical protein HPB49_026559 [Dermacentor silvarum]|nr:hypothetical protein HPB49_026559 [Dermacentor silvarum]